MRLQSYLYVITHGCHDQTTTWEVMDAIADGLDAIGKRLPGLGAQVIPVVDQEAYEEFALDAAPITAVTAGQLPAVVVRMSFDLARGPDWDAELDPLLDAHHAQLVERMRDSD